MSVYTKLNEARAKFHAIELKKSGHNKFAGYLYFTLADFLIPALEVFREVGLCAVVTFGKDTAQMRIIDVEKPADVLLIESPMGSASLKGCHEVQNIGAVETYQRRYLWTAALEIVEHDALDSTQGREDKSKKTITGTDGIADLIGEARIAELDEMALNMIVGFKDGHEMAVIRDYYALESNDEKVYLWKCFGSESKMRSVIKANAPKRDEISQG